LNLPIEAVFAIVAVSEDAAVVGLHKSHKKYAVGPREDKP
jgi:hypothetical protein